MTSQVLSRRMTKTDDLARRRFELVAAEFLVRMGARIEQRRKALNLSRAEVARRMPGKVNENQVYRWERGKHSPNPDTLQALADVLQTDVATLMAPEPAKAVPTPDPLPAIGPTLTDRLEEQVVAIAQTLALIRAENEARHAALLTHIDERTQPIQAAPRRRRPA